MEDESRSQPFIAKQPFIRAVDNETSRRYLDTKHLEGSAYCCRFWQVLTPRPAIVYVVLTENIDSLRISVSSPKQQERSRVEED